MIVPPTEIDVIMISNAKSDLHKQLTINALRTLHSSENKEEIRFNVIVFESQNQVVYNNCTTLYQLGRFNYNNLLNRGIRRGVADNILLCNNDLVFKEGFMTELLKYNYPAMSPKDPNRISQQEFTEPTMGYRTDKELSGWCLFMKPIVFEKIGKLDEDFPFWFADDAYAMQLIEKNIEQWIIPTSLVEHLGQRTLNDMAREQIDEYTHQQTEKFNLKYKRSKFSRNPEYNDNEIRFNNKC